MLFDGVEDTPIKGTRGVHDFGVFNDGIHRSVMTFFFTRHDPGPL
jgi:hypothetical protein